MALRAVLGLPPTLPQGHTGGIRQNKGARRITQPAPLNLTPGTVTRPQVARFAARDGHGSRRPDFLSQPPAEQSAHVICLESHHHRKDCNYPHFTGKETEAQVMA